MPARMSGTIIGWDDDGSCNEELKHWSEYQWVLVRHRYGIIVYAYAYDIDGNEETYRRSDSE